MQYVSTDEITVPFSGASEYYDNYFLDALEYFVLFLALTDFQKVELLANSATLKQWFSVIEIV